MTLIIWLTYLLGSLAGTLTFLLFWIYLFLLTLVFALQWLPLHWEILDHAIVSVFIDFLSNPKGDALFQCIPCEYSHDDWNGLRDYLRDVPWGDIFKLGASPAA